MDLDTVMTSDYSWSCNIGQLATSYKAFVELDTVMTSVYSWSCIRGQLATSYKAFVEPDTEWKYISIFIILSFPADRILFTLNMKLSATSLCSMS